MERPGEVRASTARLPEPEAALLLAARGLRRLYRVGGAEVRALDGIDLDLARGDFLAVVGVSGSGKSTLLHLLGGLDTPSAGSLRFEGRELAALRSKERALFRRRQVGFVFQSFHLLPALNAEDNVALGLTLREVYGAERRRLARAALERVGLAGRAAHRPAQLSGGEQQRVALARAIAHRPPLLLLDEPTGNVDRATAEGIFALLREVRAELGTAIVLVTHDEDAARRHAARRLRLRDGRIVAGEEAA